MDDLTTKMYGSVQITENDVISHSADIFRPIAQEVSMLEGRCIAYRPVSFSQTGPFEFQIIPRHKQYVNLSKTRLYMKVRITKSDGAILTNTDFVAMTNLGVSTMIRQVDIEIGGKQVPDLTNTHFHYKTYIETMLSYSFTARDSHLRASLLYPDDAFTFDDTKWHVSTAADQSANKGYKIRMNKAKLSAKMEAMIPLQSDFLQSDRFLPPDIPITIKLSRESDAFALMSNIDTGGYKIEILDMKLYVKFIELNPAITEAHARDIATKPILLPINKTEIKTHTFPTGLTTFSIPNVFSGNLPKSIIIGLLNNANYNGTYKTNPYNFQHFDLNYLCLRVNGEQVPTDPYTPDFENLLFMREYREFFDNLGIHHDDTGNIVTPDLYRGGLCFFAFDFSPDGCNGFHYHPAKTGVIDVDIRLKTALTHPLTVLVFATYNAIVSIDKNINVNVDV
jgi:hypothetical protein